MKTAKKKVLLINLTRMGDILQSTPLLQALKSRDPDIELSYLAVSGFEDVCKSVPEIDRVIPFDFKSAIAVSKEAVRYLPRRLKEMELFIQSLRSENFDAVINLSHSKISALICHLLGVKHTRGLTLDPEGYRLIHHPWARYFFTANLNRHYNRFNLVDINLGLALNVGEFAAASDEGPSPFGRHNLSFRIEPEARSQAEKLLALWAKKDAPVKIGFQPGASLPCKTWPADSFIRLGQLLQDKIGAAIVVFGTQKEVKLADKVCQPLGDAALNLAGKTDIGALGALLSRMDLLITNDTGTQHLAAAVGTPVLSLCFGSALAHETGPYGKGHTVVEASLPCYPCSFHVKCNQFRCQEQVTPRVVYSVAKIMLSDDRQRDSLRDNEARFEGTNIWRTDLDPDGFWMLRPLIRRPLGASDYINYCAREIWKEILISTGETIGVQAEIGTGALKQYFADYLSPDFNEFRHDLAEPCRALRRLEELAQAGQDHCRVLEITNPGLDESLDIIKSSGDEIGEIDKEITIIGLKLPAVNHLVLDFNFKKQNLAGNDIRHLARQTEELYRRLHAIASRFREALESWENTFRAVGWMEAEVPESDLRMPLRGIEVRTKGESQDKLGKFCEAV